GGAAGSPARTDVGGLLRRLQPLVLGRGRGHRRRAGVLAQRAAGDSLQSHQRDHLARRSRHLPTRTRRVDALLCRGGAGADRTADYKRPQSVGIFRSPATRSLGEGGASEALDAAAQKVIYPVLPKEFPTDAHVMPQVIMTKAPDGTEVHNQLFLPKDLRPGE